LLAIRFSHTNHPKSVRMNIQDEDRALELSRNTDAGDASRVDTEEGHGNEKNDRKIILLPGNGPVEGGFT